MGHRNYCLKSALSSCWPCGSLSFECVCLIRLCGKCAPAIAKLQLSSLDHLSAHKVHIATKALGIQYREVLAHEPKEIDEKKSTKSTKKSTKLT